MTGVTANEVLSENALLCFKESGTRSEISARVTNLIMRGMGKEEKGEERREKKEGRRKKGEERQREAAIIKRRK
jgi:hypothetical protein